MARKRMKKRTINSSHDSHFASQIFLGVLGFLIVQAAFMLGGLYFEKTSGLLINGLPSAIGLTIILLAGLYFNSKGKEYIFYGSFVLAFLAPLITFMIKLFSPESVQIPLINYTMAYMALLVVAAYAYIVFKLLKGER